MRCVALRTAVPLALLTSLWILSGAAPNGQQGRASRTDLGDYPLGPVDAGFSPLPLEPLETPDGRPTEVAGQVVVKFRGISTSNQRLFAMTGIGARELPSRTAGGISVLAIDPQLDPEAAAASLERDPSVEYAQPNYLRYASSGPDDPMFDRQWNLSLLNMSRAWDINPGSKNTVIVAVIDSGMAYENRTLSFTAFGFTIGTAAYRALGRISVPFALAPDLITSGRVVSPYDFIWDDTRPYDMTGHGTHVAGTLGQLTNNGQGVAGIAYAVKLMPIKVLAGEWDVIFGGSPVVGGNDVIVAEGIRYAADKGAKVINLSLGGEGAPAPLLEEAIRYAVGKGAFVAMAAGNSFEQGNPVEVPAALGPAIDGAMTVGAVGPTGLRAYYSNTGPIEIVAPGGDSRVDRANGGVIQQTFDDSFTDTFNLSPSQYKAPRFDVLTFVQHEGTSMATPHVSGLAALLISQGITNPAAIEAAIKRFAIDLGPEGPDPEYGSGLINPVAALRGLGLVK
jgi:serine protease